ncbi:MAG: Ribonuclease HII [Nitrospira sp.]|nr:MAG: Ribonuclease HII [Nitrospira sp.]
MEARSRGYRHIAGLDEAGRGPLAGPVVAAAVLLPRRCRLAGLNDSKQIVEADRVRLFGEIVRRATGVGIGAATEAEIDRLNILQASLLAMRRALMALPIQPDFLLLDAVTLSGLSIPQRPIIKGDGLSCSIAAASIVAKVTRDRLMVEYHRWYPQYNFAEHKGYGTPEHLRLLREHGPCAIHRRSFAPVQHCYAEDAAVDLSLCDESESLLD